MIEVRIETLPAVEVAYRRGIGPYGESAPRAWRQLWAWVDAKGLDGRVAGAYGFGLDDVRRTPPEARRYDACVAIEGGAAADDEAGIGVKTLPGGRYAIHTYVGPYAGIGEAFVDFLMAWLPASGETPEPTRPFLEIYVNSPSEVPESERVTELCVPIEE